MDKSMVTGRPTVVSDDPGYKSLESKAEVIWSHAIFLSRGVALGTGV